MIFPFLFIAQSQNKGKGVFTSEPIAKGTVVEISPVIVMSAEERRLLDKTLLHDYIFEWGEKKDKCCLALGYISVYNHSYEANCDYEMDFEKEVITIKTIHFIHPETELFINYTGTGNDKTPVWFNTK